MTESTGNSGKKINLKSIGFVKNSEKEPRFGSFANEITEIVLDEKFTDALNGIEDYSHVIIVFWMDKIKEYVITHQPQGNPEVPIVGIFACRCPSRPNPIAITTVKLIKHERNKIHVKGLDILDGTPVIDIKPYWPVYDEVKDGIIPEWINKLDL
jgi:tRNA-Thr(GGU) m(6)t(6)A37 methyltransferase TsaA